MATPNERKHIIVLGAGVIGLTTALKIQQKGAYRVTIIAEQFPTDPKTVKYASLSAGAHHVSIAGSDPVQRGIDLETFNTMWDLSSSEGSAPGCFMRVAQAEFYRDDNNNYDTLKLMPNFAEIPKDALIPKAVAGITCDSVNTDTPIFLNYLLSSFLANGGSIVKASVLHVDQIINGGAAAFSVDSEVCQALPDAVVACPGLGARVIGGIEDKDVYPARGQTVLLNAPWIKHGISLSGGPSKIWTYVIPRKSGSVIIGGTYDANDWHPRTRPETTTDIITRALELCPEIAPPDIRAQRQPTVEDVRPIVIEESCGLRPCRKGGPRIEVEWRETSTRKVPVVYNYGHGGFGYIASYGSASVACQLLEQALVV